MEMSREELVRQSAEPRRGPRAGACLELQERSPGLEQTEPGAEGEARAESQHFQEFVQASRF